jgi:A/G-specific adenine glycosylase
MAGAKSRVSPVRDALLAWYREHGRDLPWRRTRDPYAILVSEVMLQQTQASRVVPRYLAWLERWPTADALAGASTADVIRAWQGLGYNRRALNLQRAARQVARDGWPGDLTVLPGVGPYTAAAVACFSLGRPVLPEDVNVRRVCERTGQEFDPTCAQALMDLGATICIARVPRCGECPLASECPSRGRRFEPLRKQGPYEGSFRQRRAQALRLVAEAPRPLAEVDLEAVESLRRDELVLIEDELVRLPS